VVGGVVASIESLAAEAGASVLRAGGNAADAAVAAAFAQCVVNPIHCGVAGSFHGLFWDPGQARATVISSGGHAPAAAEPGTGGSALLGYRASTVPGFVRGAAEAHRRFGSGRLRWADLLAPAIRLAGEGFEVYPYLYRLWMPATEYGHGFLEVDGPAVLSLTEEARRTYLHSDGTVYEIGERLVQDAYARTLERLAELGPDEFYEGETAERIAADFERNDGYLSRADLRDYRPAVVDPVHATFHDYEVVTEPLPSVGPTILQALNILNGWDLAKMGWNTPLYLDRLAEAFIAALDDRERLLADPEYAEVPTEHLLSDAYAAAVRTAIERGHPAAADRPEGGSAEECTSHVTVVDGRQAGAAITHSIGTSSGVVTPGLGFLHNSHMAMFDPSPSGPNRCEPGKRPLTGGGPTLFLRDGALHLLIGSPAGVRKATAIVQAFLNQAVFGMPIQPAVAADRIHVSPYPRAILVEPFFPADRLRDLARMGHRIRYEWYSARLAGVLADRIHGLIGASDPRGDGGLAIVAPT
jgi:gamma-glutamyltranspeptidase/glutathione hydrolase